jgi:nucleotide-binding universal stress UspA family protein
MQPIQKILAPTDFSQHSEYALQYAVDLAKRYGASLSLVHVYPVVNYASAEGFALYTPEQLTALLHELGQQLHATEATARAAGVTRVDGTLVQGDAYQELLALTPSFDLIVMGTHGRTGLRHALMGSVAEKLVRSATCPVFTARKPAVSGQPTTKNR